MSANLSHSDIESYMSVDASAMPVYDRQVRIQQIKEQVNKHLNTNQNTAVSAIGYPIESTAKLQHNHIDGPLLTCTDGTPHFLTLIERLMLSLHLTSVEVLDLVHRKDMKTNRTNRTNRTKKRSVNKNTTNI